MKKRTLTVNHESGYTYSFIMFSSTEIDNLITKYDGVILKKYSNVEKDNKVYLLNDGRVLQISYVHAFLFSSFYGFLLSKKETKNYNKKIPKNFPIKRIQLTKDFQKIEYFEIDNTEVEGKKFLKEEKNTKIFQLSNDKILITYKDDIKLLFKNLKDYNLYSYYRNYTFPYVPPIMCGRNIYQQNFPKHIDELIEKLKSNFEIDSRILNFELKNLFELDKYIYTNVISDEFTHEIFLPLLAYLGKTFITNFGGMWEMEYNERFDTWSPNIRSADNNLKKIYIKLDEFLDSKSKEVNSLFFIVRF